MQDKTKKAIFGAGCFWGVEAAFRNLKGVVSAEAGYSGGTFPAEGGSASGGKNPTYEDVCTGNTGHAEVVEVEYDPSVISYEKLLEVFWKIHDPTTLNRQGPDIGTQYRSVIFFHSPEEEKIAKELKEKLEKSGIYKGKIVTEIVEATKFYKAEEYHQQYFEKRGISSPSCGTR